MPERLPRVTNPAVDEDLVRQRAFDIWEQKGKPDGTELDDWLQAENEIKQP